MGWGEQGRRGTGVTGDRGQAWNHFKAFCANTHVCCGPNIIYLGSTHSPLCSWVPNPDCAHALPPRRPHPWRAPLSPPPLPHHPYLPPAPSTSPELPCLPR